MSTHAAICAEKGIGFGFRGVYCHFDGNPGHMVEALRVIVARDGYAEAVRHLVTEQRYWSFVDPDIEVTRTPGERIERFDSRDAAVAGYGTYTVDNDARGLVTTDPDFHQNDCGGAFWRYDLTPSALEVRTWQDGGWSLPVVIPWAASEELAEAAWKEVWR